ncbi:MAG: hypothetical protein JXA58_03710 [Dehalococcoidia bacterium]|nr:hypothetical protein [Dehalococcoidia bacterium]
MPTFKGYRRSLLLMLAMALAVSPVLSCQTVEDVVGQVSEALPGAESATTPSSRPQKITGTIAVGPSIVAVSQVAEPTGATVTVAKVGDSLDGLVVEVPPGAHDMSVQYNVSSATILEHTFGAHFNPATPLITIENGGGYSEELLTVRIPVEVPPEHFAMAFYYDDETGTLEGIPSVDQDAHSVTIVTRHFSKLLVSIIKNSVLDDLLKEGIDSGFRPGADDWQFTNYGSYVAPGGHCAGQSVSAMWYYCEKPDGEDPFLWNLYDNNGDDPATPDMWEDDSRGYRFASTVQHDINWGKFEVDFQRELRGTHDEYHFKAFAYAIALTGEPQYVGISSTAGGGHAMVAYRVDSKGIDIADPNYPGRSDRRILYKDAKFTPYNSGANADEIAAGNGKAYELIGYMAKTAIIDWQLLSKRWQEFKDGVIGNDRFPAYEILMVDPEGREVGLADGYESKSDTLRIIVRSTETVIGTRIFRNGTRVPADEDGAYQLVEGRNSLGIDIWGDVNNAPQNRRFEYIDFQYIDVWYGPKETTGCKGWALESVTPDWAPKEKKWGDQYETNYLFDATDGAFSASGRLWIGEETDQGAGALEAWVLFSHEGTWTPLPPCIPFGETTTITLNLHSPVVGIDGTPAHDRGWAASYATLWVNINDWEGLYLEDSSSLRAASTTWEGATESLLFEFNLTELAYGEPREGEVIEVAVWFGALNGDGCYRYRYVYHE